jgi:ferredoxin
MAEEKGKKIVVDKEACISCGACEASVETVFKLDDENISKVIKQYDELSDEEKEEVKKIIGTCPGDAISIE